MGRAAAVVREASADPQEWRQQLRWERLLLVIGATLVLVSVVLFLFGGFTPLTRVGLYLGAGFLIFGVTIVLDEHLRRK